MVRSGHFFVDQYKLNSEIAKVHEQLQPMSKRPSESFREYGARLPPKYNRPYGEGNGTIFMSIISLTYYDRLISHAIESFANLVQLGKAFMMVSRSKR